MATVNTYKTSELVLKIKQNSYDSTKYPVAAWDRFLNVLCGNREYQRQAIVTSIIYFITEKYSTIERVVEENYSQNDSLKEKFKTFENYCANIQLPNRKSGTIDLATGTGKSYVIYGIAQMALGLGLVDKVLVLGPPSTTIEKGLTEKFQKLASDPLLRSAIPDSSCCKSVNIINANSTITDHCICVENINAVYTNTNSSIRDSLFNHGSRCLVLNDEIHHAYNKASGNSNDSKSIKKWKEFLLDYSYNFKYILGFTGTAYVDDDYFNDVIYRYSLTEAIADGFIKRINYVGENMDEDENEKFQKVYANHNKNKEFYNQVKPITILITKDIREAKQLETRLVEFLVRIGEGDRDFVKNKKVLLVTSAPEHKEAVAKLPFVDDKDEPYEWIISVAMLTEGWDVKNVFQIVPMEEKAFNSKLLIAQALGRGLRLPEKYPNAEVTVYNHTKWSKNIKHLVDEILELDTILRNSIILEGERSKYNFTLYNLTYKKEKKEIIKKNTIPVFNYKDYFEFVSEVPQKESETTYLKIGGQEITFTQNYDIKKERFLISDILDQIEESFKTRKLERIILRINGEEYNNENLPSRDVIEKMIRKSMHKVGIEGDYIGKENRAVIFKAFNTLFRQTSKTAIIVNSPDNLVSIDTSQKPSESVSIANLASDTTVFISSNYGEEIEDKVNLEIIEEYSDNRKYSAGIRELNVYNFRTPNDMVFTVGTPEEKFIKKLAGDKEHEFISSWIKSSNQNFYSIEYSIREGSHSKIKSFNPDFFILIKKGEKEYISVVEIKMDGDASEENKQKNKYAKEHFKELNKKLEEEGINQIYIFDFLSPNSYAEYFDYLRSGALLEGKFVSELDNQLTITDSIDTQEAVLEAPLSSDSSESKKTITS